MVNLLKKFKILKIFILYYGFYLIIYTNDIRKNIKGILIYLMDFKIKIDLSNQQIINDLPPKEKKKKKNQENSEKNNKKLPLEKEEKKEYNNSDIFKETPKKGGSGENKNPITDENLKKKNFNKKKIKKLRVVPDNTFDKEKPKINSNSIISLTLPNNENTKGDQAQKLGMLSKKKPRHWEKRWVLIPNVFEFTKEIWLKKWVLVDGGEDISDSNVSL
jgi:hypothetical protein